MFGLLRNKRVASGIARQWQWVGRFARLRRRRRGQIIVIAELIVGRNGSSFRCLRQRCLNVDGHPIHLVVFVADGRLQKRGQTGIERAGLLEVQSAFVNLIQLAEHMAGQRVAMLPHQTDPPRQPKHDEDTPGRLVPGPLPQRGRGEITAQLPQIRQRADALRRAQHAQNLPTIALQRREAGIEHERGRRGEHGVLPQRIVAGVMFCHESSPRSGPQRPVPLHLIAYRSRRQPTMRSAP
ncbi:hypothetical protein A458_04665 [Stutzerimonas stutzeri CCUG 29243]|uniref:Uncharacterized protein n=1 Tax=Stutzerimonas stutzeri CCUG 29243 TaxID=1196835 RepID=I4CQ26_STUST|nr:hypothetical protein A458_04665 [Stutzerimonas stutzeri CCUG 29243]